MGAAAAAGRMVAGVVETEEVAVVVQEVRAGV